MIRLTVTGRLFHIKAPEHAGNTCFEYVYLWPRQTKVIVPKVGIGSYIGWIVTENWEREKDKERERGFQVIATAMTAHLRSTFYTH